MSTAGRGAGAPTLRRRAGLGPRPGQMSTAGRGAGAPTLRRRAGLRPRPGQMTGVDPPLRDFAEEVGSSDPVCAVGGRTQWAVGGPPAPGTREVLAPGGVVAHQPAGMIVR